MTTATVAHDCPLHAGVDPEDFNVYDRKWLALACKDVAFMEDVAARAAVTVKITRTRTDDRSVRDHAFARRQIELCRVRTERIRTHMQSVIDKHAPAVTRSGDDLWTR